MAVCEITSTTDIMSCAQELGKTIWPSQPVAGAMLFVLFLAVISYTCIFLLKDTIKLSALIKPLLVFCGLSVGVIIGIILFQSCSITYVKDVSACLVTFGETMEPGHGHAALLVLFFFIAALTFVLLHQKRKKINTHNKNQYIILRR